MCFYFSSDSERVELSYTGYSINHRAEGTDPPKTGSPSPVMGQGMGGAEGTRGRVMVSVAAVVSAQQLPPHCQGFGRNGGRDDL